MELEGFQEITAILHCAVYALVWRREVVYVGKTNQPWVRLYSHVRARGKTIHRPVGYRQVKQGIKFDQVFVRPCMLGQLDELEVQMIHKYRPRYNIKDAPKATPKDIEWLVSSIIQSQPPAPVAPVRLHRRF